METSDARTIEETFAEFDIAAKVIATDIGLRFTRYTVQLPGGSTLERILPLETNIALNLNAITVRMTGFAEDNQKAYIEVSKGTVARVSLSEILNRMPEDSKTSGSLDFIVGQDVEGGVVVADLAVMPHLMIGGQTASGKSTMLSSMLVNLLSTRTPDDLRIILIDPKQVEFSKYSNVPHLLRPVATKPEEWEDALLWVEQETVRRLRLFADSGKSDINDYNLSSATPLSRIVVMTDEFSDMMMANSAEMERIVSAITLNAAATGIHLILSTSRSSADVYTDAIKNCFTARIAFAVASRSDSLALLDEPGVEKLLGQGDMLFKSDRNASPVRLQGAYVPTEYVEQLLQRITPY